MEGLIIVECIDSCRGNGESMKYEIPISNAFFFYFME